MKTPFFVVTSALISAFLVFAVVSKTSSRASDSASLSTSNGYAYEISGSEATITGYTGSEKDISIPEKIKDSSGTYKVTAIDGAAFNGQGSLTSIDIPETVSSIGDQVFYKCTNLKSIDIPESVKSIGDGAFESCSKLTTIKMPAGIKSIGDRTFYGCSKLTAIDIPESVKSIGDRAFYNCIGLKTVNAHPLSAPKVASNVFHGVPSDSALCVEPESKGYDREPWTNFQQRKFEKTLKSISVTPPTKTNYKVGEYLDISGLVVTGTFSDGTSSEITEGQYTLTGFDSSYPAVDQEVTVTAGGKTATFKVNITENDNNTAQSASSDSLNQDSSTTSVAPTITYNYGSTSTPQGSSSSTSTNTSTSGSGASSSSATSSGTASTPDSSANSMAQEDPVTGNVNSSAASESEAKE